MAKGGVGDGPLLIEPEKGVPEAKEKHLLMMGLVPRGAKGPYYHARAPSWGVGTGSVYNGCRRTLEPAAEIPDLETRMSLICFCLKQRKCLAATNTD